MNSFAGKMAAADEAATAADLPDHVARFNISLGEIPLLPFESLTQDQQRRQMSKPFECHGLHWLLAVEKEPPSDGREGGFNLCSVLYCLSIDITDEAVRQTFPSQASRAWLALQPASFPCRRSLRNMQHGSNRSVSRQCNLDNDESHTLYSPPNDGGFCKSLFGTHCSAHTSYSLYKMLSHRKHRSSSAQDTLVCHSSILSNLHIAWNCPCMLYKIYSCNRHKQGLFGMICSISRHCRSLDKFHSRGIHSCCNHDD